jgi:CheY-like chemotaxis protein
MKAMWIDDDPYNLESSKELLELYGMNIQFFTNYETALERLREKDFKYDIIIMDIMMPPQNFFNVEETDDGRRTGILLIPEIRKIYSGPILLYSVLRNTKLIDNVLYNDSKIDYLRKPERIENIISKIKLLTQ